MQNDKPNYETRLDRQLHPADAPEEKRLGSARPNDDPLDGVAGTGPAGIPHEIVAAESRPVDVIPREALPVETQPLDFMTPDTRPHDVRPREVFPAEGR